MRRIGILGSTGSIGQGALKVIERHLDAFQVVALAAKSNIDLLERQCNQFQPEVVAVWDEEKAHQLQAKIPHIPVLAGQSGVCALATLPSIDQLLSAMSSFDGVLPTLKAIESGKDIALANKEVLVSAGSLVMDLVRSKGVELIPVDSEHTAIFQCLKGEDRGEVARIILTGSGGPFRNFLPQQLAQVTLDQALSHPNYRMGPKVTIDSSTLMNKGLEMIEAHFLYGISFDQLELTIHPEQIIHGMVEFVDGSIMAQMGEPNMLIPIQVALTHPKRLGALLKPFNFRQGHTLTFLPPDRNRFRCLDIAFQSLQAGGSHPCFMSAANEVLVERFLNRQIRWIDIGEKLERLLGQHASCPIDNYEVALSIDVEARRLAKEI